MGDEETKNLLKSCAENLLNVVSRHENRPQVSSPVTTVTPVVPVVEEHSRLFGYRPPNNSHVSSTTSSMNGKQPVPKRCVVATSTGDHMFRIHGQQHLCVRKKKCNHCPFTF